MPIPYYVLEQSEHSRIQQAFSGAKKLDPNNAMCLEGRKKSEFLAGTSLQVTQAEFIDGRAKNNELLGTFDNKHVSVS